MFALFIVNHQISGILEPLSYIRVMGNDDPLNHIFWLVACIKTNFYFLTVIVLSPNRSLIVFVSLYLHLIATK